MEVTTLLTPKSPSWNLRATTFCDPALETTKAMCHRRRHRPRMAFWVRLWQGLARPEKPGFGFERAL